MKYEDDIDDLRMWWSLCWLNANIILKEVDNRAIDDFRRIDMHQNNSMTNEVQSMRGIEYVTIIQTELRENKYI